MASTTSPISARTASRAQRRQQLIEATIAVLARRGYAQTTLSDVAAEAGLSHGLVNFYFASKDGLLAETLQHLSSEYHDNWNGALAAAGPSVAERLAAVLAADFNPRVCAPAKLAAWTAFWSEAQSAPLYRAQCGESDDRYELMLEDLCRRLVAEGSYALDASLVARALRVTVAGLWLDIQTTPEPRPAREALDVVFATASAFFPRHFDGRGAIVMG